MFKKRKFLESHDLTLSRHADRALMAHLVFLVTGKKLAYHIIGVTVEGNAMFLWSTVSKAEDRSNITKLTESPVAIRISLRTLTSAISALWILTKKTFKGKVVESNWNEDLSLITYLFVIIQSLSKHLWKSVFPTWKIHRRLSLKLFCFLWDRKSESNVSYWTLLTNKILKSKY